MSDEFVDNKPKIFFSVTSIVGCYRDMCRWLQVKLLHFSATNQVSLSNLDEEEYF
ncbi:hypothetical protein Avbf_00002 [Armadillidium vulgare]|nr:hypothetical protein Avbf_00002 [Armadillidium vulgare]